ncbi:MAG: hypothetical protein OZSIB_3704 [Candidatus Ozemobacter sibiricus]|uniref:HEAT repeat domain-containing protein n=1 Tax=Candidatus Ozemobacter sibiricus TaxID=2268124 RepID=A0A367ZCZ9_9BACT|nr:MAG: hypothetical protein OZSIB_3704 [Candidatus Ozemobacter sibiricus]
MWRQAYQTLEEYLLHDPSIQVRAAAARAIGECRLPQGVPVLLKLLAIERSLDFQRALIDGLAGVRGAAAIDGLIRFLKTNPPVPIRLHLVQTFQRLDNRSVLPALRELEATEKDPSVRTALAEAIRSIQAPASPRPI